MRDLSHYLTEELLTKRKKIKPAYAFPRWRQTAEKRVMRVAHWYEPMTEVLNSLVASGNYDELLLGWVDPHSQSLRDQLIERATQANGGVPTNLSTRADSAQFLLPLQISIRRSSQGLILAELWMYPQPEAENSTAWIHDWFVLQDDIRLVPVETRRSGPDCIVAGFIDQIAPVVSAAAEWLRVRELEHRNVANKYVRDGSPHYALR